MMAARPISVEAYTASHRVLGRITPTASGLFSYLNIPTTSYLEIEGAHLMRLHQPGKLVYRLRTARLHHFCAALGAGSDGRLRVEGRG